ncbi:MAG: sulfite exporter TauE/SafE family protein [bacterium]|nr:sulfite exporter TauE/SafE family protein [bacterium]
MSPPLPDIILVVLIIFLAAFVRSTFGFGDALVAMPLLALVVELPFATPLVGMLGTSIAMVLLIKHWRKVQFAGTWRLVVASIAGIPIGLYLLKGSFDTPLKLILGGGIIIFAAYNLLKPRLLAIRNDNWAWLFGFVAGILGGAFNTNGPPVVIYSSLRRWNPATFRATMQGYFLPVNVTILVGHIMAGLWTRPVLKTYAICAPLIALSIWAGDRLSRHIPPGRFDKLIHSLLLLSGCTLVIQTLIRLYA